MEDIIKDLPRLVMNNGMDNMNVFYSDKFLNTTNHPELRCCNRRSCMGNSESNGVCFKIES